MRKDVIDPDRSQMAIRRMRFACWISNAIDTHLEYEILNFTATMVTRMRLSVTLYVSYLFVYQAIKSSFIEILKLSIIITTRRFAICLPQFVRTYITYNSFFYLKPTLEINSNLKFFLFHF
jgi:hypothetical protein